MKSMKKPWFLPALAMLLLVVACDEGDSDSGGDDDDNGAATTARDDDDDDAPVGWCGAPGIPDASNVPCDACLNRACCSEANACGSDEVCVACLNGSTGAACSGGNAAYGALVQCISDASSTCETQCGTAGGGGGLCKATNEICTPLGGECCVGLTCCEQTSPPSCQEIAACNL
ncbi:MAG: hypothetical protein AAGA56_20415 [Myxococcota bacterium]